ncbi:MAG: autotransporter-associated beta strand repeat-containing protein [Chthoniobacteraceae bacterium]
MIKFVKNGVGLWVIQTLWAAAMVVPAAQAETIVSLSSDAPLVTTSLSYDGGGAIVNGNGYSGFFVESGSLSLSNVTLTNFVTTGGTGSGGGAALGGAIYVNSGATATLTNVSFSDNGVVGGTGGVGTTGGSLNNRFNVGTTGANGTAGENADSGSAYVNGGNGWNGYNGSSGANGTSGSGGTGGAGGSGSAGSATTADTVKAALDATYDALMSAGDTSLAATYTAIAATFTAQAAAATAGLTTAGLATGYTALATEYTTMASEASTTLVTADTIKAAADAAYTLALTVTSLETGVSGNGGNGGTGGNGGNSSFGYGGGAGGAGGNGGDAYSASNAIGGAGGNGGTGGNGGFGAGGGSGGNGGSAGSDGNDATNAGADGSGGSGGTGGFGAGNGSTADGSADGTGGNGGSGYGGSIFVASGGTLNINGNATFSQGHALGGGSENGGDSGESAGTDLFMMKGSTVNLNAGDGVITFNGTIADDSKASIGTSSIADGKGASININSGLVIFNGANTYSGVTNINGGVLQAWDGVGLYTNSNLNLAGGVFQTSGVFDRYVGTAAWKVQWTGDGGFAAVDGGLTVRLNGGITLTWDTNSFVPTGHSLLFGSTSATDSVTFVNSIDLNGGNRSILVTANSDNSDTAILTGVLSNGALTVNDATHTGILILTNVNTYDGGTTINAGILALSGSGALNANGAVAVSGTFDISMAKDQTIGDLSGSGVVNLGSNRLTLNLGDSTFSGSINDGGLAGGTGGSVTKRGSGTLTLTGTNTYTGGTIIDAGGTIAMKNNGTLYYNGAVEANGTFDISQGISQTIGDLSGSGTVALGSNRLTLNIGDSTFSGAITDGGIGGGTGGSITKRGSGTLTLTGTNTYTGGTIIDAGGTIAMKDNGTLYSNGTVQANGTFDISQGISQTIGDLSGSGTVALGSNRLTLNSGNSLFSGAITDGGIGSGTGGSVTKRGSGTLTLTGTNTYTGGTIIDAGGTIAMKANGTLYSNGAVQANGIFDISQGISQTIGDLSGSGTVSLGSNRLTLNIGDSTFSGLIADGGIGGGTGGSLTKRGSGTLTLTGTGTYTGGTIIDAGGTLALKNSAKLYSNGAVESNGVFDISQGTNQTIGDLSGSGEVNLGSNQLTLNLGNSTFSGSINDGGIGEGTGGSLVKRGSGTLTLTGTSTYTGGTVINTGGTIALKANGQLYGNGAVTANGVFDISQAQNQTIGDLSGSGLVSLGANQLSLNLGNSTFSGTIADGGIGGGTGGSLVKRGSGTLTLTGTNTYTGGTIIDEGGTLALSGNGSLYSGGALEVNGTFDVTAKTHDFTVGSLSGSGLVALGDRQLTFGAAANTAYSGVITGSTNAALIKEGTGEFAFSGTSSVLSWQINTGSVALEASSSGHANLSTQATVTVSGTGALIVNNNNTIQTLTTSGVVSGSATLTATQYNLNDGAVINAKLGTGTIYSNGAVTANASLGADSIYIQSGILTLGAADILSHNATVDISVDAKMILAGGDQTILNLTGAGNAYEENNYVLHVTNGGDYSGNLVSVGSLVKSGTGSLTLSGSNEYAAGTTVESGTLIVDGLLTSQTVVDANGTLKGSGTVNGDVTNNGILAPGNSPGTLTISGNYTENAILQIEIGGTAGAGVNPNGNDQVVVSGVTQLNSQTSVLELKQYNSFTPQKGDSFQIINAAAGSIKGTFSSITSDLNLQGIFSRWNGTITFTGLSSGENLENAFSNLTSNQKAMLNDLKVGQDQYDGGNLIVQLLQSSNPSVVFDKASPEAYAGNVDYALRALRAYSDNARNMESVLVDGKYEFFGGYSGFSAGANSSVDLANYDLNGNAGIAGVRGQLTQRVSLGFFVGFDNGTIDSTFLRSDVTGSVWGLFSEVALTPDRRFLAIGTVSAGFFSTDGTRSTSHFSGIDTNSQEVSLALQYAWLKGSNYSVTPEIKLAYSHASMGGFSEKNKEVSEALKVNGIDADSILTELAINADWQALSRLTLRGRLAVYHDFADASRDVTAHLVKETTDFTVQAPGMGQTEVNFSVGANYRFSNRVGMGLSYKGGYNPDAKFSNNYSANVSISF